jgi:hypothetical protein
MLYLSQINTHHKIDFFACFSLAAQIPLHTLFLKHAITARCRRRRRRRA